MSLPAIFLRSGSEYCESVWRTRADQSSESAVGGIQVLYGVGPPAGSWRFGSVVSKHFAAGASGETAPGGEIDAVADEADAAVGEEHVDAAQVPAARGREPFVMASVAAVPGVGVWRVGVVVQAVS